MEKNIFLLPSGAAGKRYIRETTRLIDAWNKNSEALKNVALKAVMIMPHLLLQKPSFKAKSKEHSISLSRRMSLWQAGEFDISKNVMVRGDGLVLQSKFPRFSPS